MDGVEGSLSLGRRGVTAVDLLVRMGGVASVLGDSGGEKDAIDLRVVRLWG